MTRCILLIISLGWSGGLSLPQQASAQDKADPPARSERAEQTLEVQLDGRSLVFSPDPAFCDVDSATVYVSIRVDRQGFVQSATSLQSSNYMPSPCTEAALEHARKVRFSISSTAKPRQQGTV